MGDALGEVLREPLDPPEYGDYEDEEEGYSAADRMLEDAIDEQIEQMIADARSELI
jgi:hypothetical protein